MAITYAPTTNFGLKDSLPTNDSDKVIRGSEFTTEFTAIQTAFSLAAPAASPTFTGTVTIPTADINGGNIDGTVIGAATPAAGSFTTITASDDVNFDSGTFFVDASANAVGIGTTSPTYKLDVQGGSSRFQYNAANQTAGEFYNTNATGYGVFIQGGGAASRYALNVTDYAGTSILYAGNSNNVGIGTTSPEDPLHVAGDIRTDNAAYIVQETSTGGAVRMLGINAGNTAYVGPIDSGPTDAIFNASSTSNTSAFYTAGTERMRIDSSGNVGIGTSSPYAKTVVALAPTVAATTVNETADFADQFVIANSGTSTNGDRLPLIFNLGSDDTDNISAGIVALREASGWNTALSFWTNNVTGGAEGTDAIQEKMRITSAGNVGIGTSSPGRIVEVGGSQPAIKFNNGTHAWSIGTGAFVDGSDSFVLFQDGTGEALRVDSSGNLLVGTTTAVGTVTIGGVQTPTQPALYAQSYPTSHPTAYIYRDNTDAQYCLKLRHDGPVTGSGNGYMVDFKDRNDVTVGSITVSGSTTAYNTSSDQRLKENIVDAPSASDDIDAIQVRSFDWKADGPHQKYGMVAQELLEVAPEAVSGDPESDDMMGVDYSKLVPMLVKEIQSLRARVAQLEGV